MMLNDFGSTGMRVSEIGLGCARIGGIFKNDPKQFLRLLDTAKARGINFFDTADMYSQGESEALIGKAFRSRRHEIIIASKVGYCLPGRRQWIARIKPLVRPLVRLLKLKRERLPMAVKGEITQNFSPSYLRSALDASLRRLRTDHLDLLQLHSPPAAVVAAGEWLETLEQLKRAGKLRFYGISCDTEAAAQAALGFDTLSAVQIPISLLTPQLAEGTLLPRAREKRIAVIARECLANGLLVKPESEVQDRFADLPEAVAAARRERLHSLRATARERNIPLSRLAMDYVKQLAGVSVSLIGASRPEQLEATLRELAV